MAKLSLLLGFLLCMISAVSAAGVDPARLQQAKDLESAGRLDEAVQEYRALLLANPNDASIHLALGDLRARQGKHEAAVRHYQDALAIDSKRYQASAGMARSYTALGQKEKAAAEWRRLTAEGVPSSIRKEANQRLAGDAPNEPATQSTATSNNGSTSAVAKKGTTPKAAVGKFDYDSPDFRKGLEAYQAGKWDASLDSWRKVLAAEPGNPGAYYYAGVCRYNLGQMDKAEYNLLRSSTYPDKGFNSSYYLGRIYEKQGKKTEAAKQYQTYLAKTSSSQGRSEVQKRLSELGVVVEQKTEAKSERKPETKHDAGPKTDEKHEAKHDTAKSDTVKPLDLTLTGMPTSVVEVTPGVLFAIHDTAGPGATAMRKARENARSGKWNQSIAALKEVRLQYPSTPNDVAAASNLVALHSYLGLDDGVRNLAEAILRNPIPEPYRNSVRFLLARSLSRLGQYAEASRVLDSVGPDKGLGPQPGDRSMLQGDIARLSKGGKDEPSLLQKAVADERDPSKRNQIRLRLAKAWIAAGKNPQAIETYHAALDSCGTDEEVCRTSAYGLADLQYKGANLSVALEYYRKAVNGWADSTDSPWGLYQIGNILRSKGDLAGAAKAYAEVSSKYPGSYWAEQANWRREDVVWRQKNSSVLPAD